MKSLCVTFPLAFLPRGPVTSDGKGRPGEQAAVQQPLRPGQDLGAGRGCRPLDRPTDPPASTCPLPGGRDPRSASAGVSHTVWPPSGLETRTTQALIRRVSTALPRNEPHLPNGLDGRKGGTGQMPPTRHPRARWVSGNHTPPTSPITAQLTEEGRLKPRPPPTAPWELGPGKHGRQRGQG